MKCVYCGAEAVAVDESKFSCPYCGGTFETEKKKEEPSTPKREARRPSVVMPRKNEGATVFETNVDSVLEITWNPTPYTMTSGSGLLIDRDGYALTNAHVVTDENGNPAREVKVKVAGVNVKASVIRLGDKQSGRGSGVDLALIKLSKVPEKAKNVVFADFEQVRIGEQVFVIGNSLGDGTCITAGIVSDKQRKINGHTVLMTDCAINGGNSGGPIFDAEGNVIGVICSSRVQEDGSATEGMNYAIPINIAKDFVEGKYVAVNVTPDYPSINYKVASNPRGPVCPKCGSTETDVENNIRYCYSCDYEW